MTTSSVIDRHRDIETGKINENAREKVRQRRDGERELKGQGQRTTFPLNFQSARRFHVIDREGFPSSVSLINDRIDSFKI